jgi:hypothetical protein
MLHEYSVSGQELSKVLNFITEQPTAYDVDKVVEKLEAYKEQAEKMMTKFLTEKAVLMKWQ